MTTKIDYQSPGLQKIVAEKDVQFLLTRLHRHVPEVYHHSLRVAGLFELLWANEELAPETRERALRSVLLHDIGYIHIPREKVYEPPESFDHWHRNLIRAYPTRQSG